jgi:F0F1-type ATP synthase assembly protein I
MNGSSSSERTPGDEQPQEAAGQAELPELPKLPEPPEIRKPDISLPATSSRPIAPVQKGMRAMALASTIGLSLVVPPVLGYFGGRWLDGRFDTEPVLSVVGLIIGIVVGFIEMLHILAQIERLERQER